MSHPLVWDHEPATSLCGRWWILRRSCFIPLILLEATRATGRGEELRVPGDRAWSVHAHHWPLTATPSVRGCWDPEGQSSGKLRRSRGKQPRAGWTPAAGPAWRQNPAQGLPHPPKARGSPVPGVPPVWDCTAVTAGSVPPSVPVRQRFRRSLSLWGSSSAPPISADICSYHYCSACLQ